MTDPTPAGGYTPAESFESGRVTAVAAGESRVVVGTAAGNVELVTTDGRTTVTFDDPVTDLAVGSRVYALVGDTVTALSAAGTRVWSVELGAARRLAALPGADVVGAVTDDDRLLGFDGETGGRAFEVERPYADVTDDPGFFGTDGAFVLTAWSFLAVRNLDGTERFDLNLDGAIESAGIVDETVVVSLKDERVVGVHATAGEREWERELSVTDLPDRGDDALLFGADGQLVALSADGTYATVGDFPGGDVYPTSDGDLFCAVTDGTVRAYRASGDPGESLSISAADDELVPGETDAVELDVRNEGDRPVEASLDADGDGVALDGTARRIDLAPGESAAWTLGVERVAADDDAAVSVAADGESLASVALSVADRPGGSLVADADLAAVSDGVATFVVEVANEGDAPATGVSVSPGDATVGRLGPGESATAPIDVETDLGAVVPVSVRSDDDAFDLEATVPDDGIEVGVEAGADGFVDVRVENATDARLADDLAVAGDCFDARVERRVDLPERGTLVLALEPDARRGPAQVEATLAGIGVARSARFGPDDLGARRTGRSDAPRRSDGPRRSERGEWSGRANRSGSPRRSEEARRSERGGRSPSGRSEAERSDGRRPRAPPTAAESRATSDDDPATGTDRRAASGTDDRTTDDSGRRTNREADRRKADESGHRTSDENDRRTTGGTATAGPDLSAERLVETADPDRTRAVGERLVVENEGEATAEGVAVELPEGTVPVGAIPPGDRATVERRHAFYETGEVALPAVGVTAENAPEVEVAERTLAVGTGALAAEAEFESADDGHRLRVAVANDREVACEVERLGVRGLGVWDLDDCRVPPGETVELARTVESPDDSTVGVAVGYAFADGEPDRWVTLAAVPDAGAADPEGVAALDATVGDETRVSGGYGSVVLAVENRSESSLADVSVEATGDDVSDLMYGGRETVGELGPGDRFTHFVDVETEGPEATVSVALAADGDETELTLAGPAPADEDDWSAESLEAWRVAREGDGDSGGSSHVVTEFERA